MIQPGDLGAALAMRPTGDTVRMVLSAQMAKDGPPMNRPPDTPPPPALPAAVSLGGGVTVFLSIYLTYALIRPERF